MSHLILRPPSVGSLVKKILEINPALGTQEIIQLVRQATRTQSDAGGESSPMEFVDEQVALKLAQETLPKLSFTQ